MRLLRILVYVRVYTDMLALLKLQATACRSVEDCWWEKRTHCSPVVFRLRWSEV